MSDAEKIEALGQYALRAVQAAEKMDIHVTIEVPRNCFGELAYWFDARVVENGPGKPPQIRLRGVTIEPGVGRRNHVGYIRR